LILTCCIGKRFHPGIREYYHECSRVNQPAIVLEPTQYGGGYYRVIINFLTTFDGEGGHRQIPEEQGWKIRKIVDKYRKFMPKNGSITYDKFLFEVKVKRKVAQQMLTELGGVIDDPRAY